MNWSTGRRLAVQRVIEGYSTEEVADFLGVDPSSVRRWVASFRAGGEQELVARPASGRPPKLTPAHGEDHSDVGWARARRRTASRPNSGPPPRLGQSDPGRVRHRTPSEVSQRLAACSGVLAAEAPSASPAKRDPEGGRRAAGGRLAAHQKKARRQSAHIALIDESGLLTAPAEPSDPGQRTAGRPNWCGRAGQREKVSVAAAVWLSPGRERLGLYAKDP